MIPVTRDGPIAWTRTCPRCGADYTGRDAVEALNRLAGHLIAEPACLRTANTLPLYTRRAELLARPSSGAAR